MPLPTLTAEQWKRIQDAVEAKRDAVASGFYDDYEDEIDDPDGETADWANHLESILDAEKPEDLDIEDWNEVYYCLELGGCDKDIEAIIGVDGANMEAA